MSALLLEEGMARKQVLDWAEVFEVDPDEETIRKLLPSVRRGRVELDVDSGCFRVKLVSPLSLENGQTLASITVAEPTAGDLIIKGDEATVAMKMISNVTGHPVGIIRRFKQRDMVLLSGLISFFS